MKLASVSVLFMLTALPGVFCTTSQAADTVSINVTGKVVASPCTIKPDDVVKNISLGDTLVPKVETGSMSAIQKFTVTLTDCPPGTSSVTATFSGAPASSLPDWTYANTAATTPAANVGVVLQTSGGGSGLGNGKTYKIDIQSGVDPVFNLETYAYSLGSSMPGNISASIVMSLSYN